MASHLGLVGQRHAHPDRHRPAWLVERSAPRPLHRALVHGGIETATVLRRVGTEDRVPQDLARTFHVALHVAVRELDPH